MEAFGIYLLKSVVWLTGFTLIFFLFLKNERFFLMNRLYLISGILISFLFPLLTVHYTVDLPVPVSVQTEDPVISGFQEVSQGNFPDIGFLLFILYISGALFVAFMILKQGKSVIKSIKKAEIITSHPVKLIRTADYSSSFSFFSYVFVNPSVTDHETEEIMNHEMVHISQMHWVDLMLVELLRVLQWFNPLVWIYIRFIRQNHEYLADEIALQRTSDPAKYRAALLNQIIGSPVVSLANSFNYSLNKKRFNMMKNNISSPYRKMKIFLILPVFAIILYAFASPEYRSSSGNTEPHITGSVPDLQGKVVKGVVTQQDGKPLDGAAVILQGTTTGIITDSRGSFSLNNVTDESTLIVSYVGFKSKVLKPVFTSDMIIKMVRDTVKIGSVSTPPPPPPPPPGKASISGISETNTGIVPPPPVIFRSTDGSSVPLIILDGKITDISIESIDPNTIESVTVLKDQSATSIYGDKGSNGVILITRKKNYTPGLNTKTSEIVVEGYGTNQKEPKDIFMVVEEMPAFPGGVKAMEAWLSGNIKYPGEAAKKNITGTVVVDFVISNTGKVQGVKVNRGVDPLLDAEAVRVVSSMPDWKAGTQQGKPVDVYMKVPINFVLGKVIKDTNK